MKRIILIVLFLIFISSCNNKNVGVTEIKGFFINNSLFEFDPLVFDFYKDSLFILYPYRSDILKNKFALSKISTLQLTNPEFDVDLKYIKNLNNKGFILTGTKNTVSIKDTIILTPVHFEVTNINYKSLSGYWYSKDFIPLKQGEYWLKFNKNKLYLKSKFINNEIFLQEFDYSINTFGRIKTLNIKFPYSDAILFFDKIDENKIQLLNLNLSDKDKYFVHLNKIEVKEYNNAKLNISKEKRLPTLKLHNPIKEIEEEIYN